MKSSLAPKTISCHFFLTWFKCVFSVVTTDFFIKTDLTGEEFAASVLKQAAKKNLTTDKLAPSRTKSLGIATAKKANILKELASRMLANRRGFWESLPESESSDDLLKSFE